VIVNVVWKLAVVAIYAALYELTPLRLDPGDWWVWVLLFFADDLAYYTFHRVSHESRVFWASHVVHHSSQHYNLSTALRQTWVPMTYLPFWLPLPLLGFEPWMVLLAQSWSLIYQFGLHTERIGRLPRPVEAVLNTPSHHRVHHGANEQYLDRNYGGILIIWDRLFGSFVPEGERCVYGTRAPLDSWDPLWANVEVYAALARKSQLAPRWADKLRVWFKPPGWRPPDADPAAWPVGRFTLENVRRYDPPMTRALRWFGGTELTLSILATVPLLWMAAELPARTIVAWTLAVAITLWLTGAVMQGRLRIARALLWQAIAIAVAIVAAAA
jgi:hypothetical protein